MWAVARRPRWILALLFALAVAAGFAALGQWQLSRAVEAGAVSEQDFDAVVPLESVATPNGALPVDAVGQMVSAEVTWVDADLIVLTDRLQDGKRVSWLVGHAIVDDGPSLAVALGWYDQLGGVAAGGPLPDRIQGRLLPSESPQESDFEAGEQSALSVAALINQWSVAPDGVYGGYVVLDGEALGPGRDRGATALQGGLAQPAQHLLRDRVGHLRRLRDLPLVAPRPRRLREGARHRIPRVAACPYQMQEQNGCRQSEAAERGPTRVCSCIW